MTVSVNRVIHLGVLMLIGAVYPIDASAQFILRSGSFSMGGPVVAGPDLRLESTIGIPFGRRVVAEGLRLDNGFLSLIHPPAGPLAQAIAVDDQIGTPEDTGLILAVLANDIAPAGDSLRIVSVGEPTHGVADIDGNLVRYTPEKDFFGQDSFEYTVQASTGVPATAIVTVEVFPVNDPPEFRSAPKTAAIADHRYEYTIEVRDVDNTSLQLSAPVLPEWLSIAAGPDGTAILSGTPSASDVGNHPVRLVISDGEASTEQSFEIVVAAGGLAAPELLAPENRADIADTRVELSWNLVPGAVGYDVQVDDHPDFSSPIEVASHGDTTLQLTDLPSSSTIHWRVRAVSSDGPGPYSAVFQFTTVSTVATESLDELPTEYSLNQNYPNPFNPTTTIPYELPEAGHVRIAVFDLFGREVARLVDDTKTAGRHKVAFEAADLPSGTYFYVLETPGWHDARKLVVLK